MNASIACRAAGGSVMVAGSVRPAWTEGGLTQARAGSVVAGSVRPAWTEGGLTQAPARSLVAGASRPAWDRGGPRLTRPRAPPPPFFLRGVSSPGDPAPHTGPPTPD